MIAAGKWRKCFDRLHRKRFQKARLKSQFNRIVKGSLEELPCYEHLHHSSYTTHHTSLIIHHSSYTTHHTPLIIHHSSDTTHHTPLIIQLALVLGTALCEPPCADFVAGTALCEPPCADFVAGAALCEPPCADFAAGAIQNAFSRDSGRAK